VPEVSVCMPVFNGGRFLREAIESVLTQDWTDFELIIVDDASTDNSYDIASSFNDPRLRVHRNEVAAGMPGNWNVALSRVTGRYVKFLFQDDILYPDCISTMVAALKRHETAGFVFSRRDIEELDGLRSESFYAHLKDLQAPLRTTRLLQPLIPGMEFLRVCIRSGGLYFNYIAEPSFVMFDAKLIQRVGYFSSNLRQNADYEYWLRLMMISDACFIDRPLGKFRMHRSSESSLGKTVMKRIGYLREERAVIGNLLSFVREINLEHIVQPLDRRQKWFYVYRLPFIFTQRLARIRGTVGQLLSIFHGK
jgi:glycosyltransferase involved in cell wall biosynthesis